MGILKYILPICLSITLLSCGKNMSHIKNNVDDDIVPIFTDLVEGDDGRVYKVLPDKALGLDGEEVDFGDDNHKLTILQISSSTCIPCEEETREFLAHLKDTNIAPSKINIITHFVNIKNEQDLLAEKNYYKIPWKVTFYRKWKQSKKLIKKYCKKNETPCLVINHPEDGIIYSKPGKIPLEDLLKLTGDWE